MDASKFREIEVLYKDLKERQAAGEVSAEDMKSELKKMMVRDEENRYWMLGGKSGGWYVYDGSAWNAADPYAGEASAPAAPVAADPVVVVAPPAETRLRATPAFAARGGEDKPETFCKFCHSRMDEHDAYCRFCGASPKAAESRPAKPAPSRPVLDDEIHVRAVRLLSLAIFFGGLGLVAGVVLGASFGIFKIFGDLIYQFPLMLQEMHGKFLGGLFFGALGGIAGFAVLAVLGVLLGLAFNALCFVFTGPRFKIRT
jgi:hypothetical protein